MAVVAVDDDDDAADAVVGKSAAMSCNSVGDESSADDDKGNVAKSVGDNENFMLQGVDDGIVSRLSLFKQSILSLLDDELNDIDSFKLMILLLSVTAAVAATAAALAAAAAARSHSSTHWQWTHACGDFELDDERRRWKRRPDGTSK